MTLGASRAVRASGRVAHIAGYAGNLDRVDPKDKIREFLTLRRRS
jgi:hypothetical protein